MPEQQGVVPWPHEGTGNVALADEAELPFQDYSIDRVRMVHALESGKHQSDMLREVCFSLGAPVPDIAFLGKSLDQPALPGI